MPEDSARSHEAMCLWSGRPPGGAAALTGDVSHGEFEAMLLLATLQRILLTILGALALRAVMLRLAPMLSLAPPPPEEPPRRPRARRFGVGRRRPGHLWAVYASGLDLAVDRPCLAGRPEAQRAGGRRHVWELWVAW